MRTQLEQRLWEVIQFKIHKNTILAMKPGKVYRMNWYKIDTIDIIKVTHIEDNDVHYKLILTSKPNTARARMITISHDYFYGTIREL